MNPTFLKIINGNVDLYNWDAQCIRHYYNKSSYGEAVRVDWHDKANESIEVLTKSGIYVIINKSCQPIRKI